MFFNNLNIIFYLFFQQLMIPQVLGGHIIADKTDILNSFGFREL